VSRRGHVRLAHLATSLALVLLFSLSACGDDEAVSATDDPSSTDSSPDSSPTSTPSASESPDDATSTPEDVTLTIDVTREADEFTPNGARVDAAIGEPVVLSITSDEAGELHVHSVPEQEISYDAGTSEHEITVDRSGVVEVESHDPDVIVLQLEVR